MPIRAIINKIRQMLRLDFKIFPAISTERLLLRQLELRDAPGILALRTHPEVNAYLDRPLLQRIEEARDVIQSLNHGVANNSWIFWGVALKSSDQLIGTICIWNIFAKTATADIGYELHPDYQGKGIMQEALSEVLDYGFNTMQLEKIQAFTHKDNSKSLKLLQRNGFVRDAAVEIEERTTDKGMVVYSRGRGGD